MIHRVADVIVIGAGLAGLTAAWQVASRGKRVRVVSKGWATTHWHSGCIDVLGYLDQASATPCKSPAVAVEHLIRTNPSHPYALTGLGGIDEAVEALRKLCGEAGYPLHGSFEKNWFLPSAVGAVRPTCLAPKTMIAGDLRRKDPMLIVGFQQLKALYARLAADNLQAQGIQARGVTLDLDRLQQRRYLTTSIVAEMFDSTPLMNELAEALKPHLGDAKRVGFPAVLGLRHPLTVLRTLEKKLNRPVFEIPTLPPSVPGMRLHLVLKQAVTRQGGQVFDGMEIIGADVKDDLVSTVYSEAAARRRAQPAQVYLLASGGLLGGGITTDLDGNVRESILDLPVRAPSGRADWFKRDFFDADGHALHRVGVDVDKQFRPVGKHGAPLYANLFAAGTILADCDAIRERSLEGIAVATGFLAGGQAASYDVR
jgi:glycerol-3-phosphate dehydrogenase subunit B